MCRIGGRPRSWAARFGGVAGEIPLWLSFDSNLNRKPVGKQCQVGSLTGAVASQKVTEACKGSLRLNGNQSKSANAKGSLTARQTSRAETKVGVSDPMAPSGRAMAHRIKATPGITG